MWEVLKKKKRNTNFPIPPLLCHQSPWVWNLYYVLCCHAKNTLSLLKFLWCMSVKYQKPAMELSVSHLVFHFCPCRALTSLMKTHLPGCLFFPCLLMTRESWAQPVGNKRHGRRSLNSRDVLLPVPLILAWPSFQGLAKQNPLLLFQDSNMKLISLY